MGGVGLYHHAPLTVPEAVVTPARNNRTNTYVHTYMYAHSHMYVCTYISTVTILCVHIHC